MKTKAISLIFSAFTLSLSAQTLEDGIKALDCEQYSYAQRIFSLLHSTNPLDAEVLYYKGMAFYATGMKDSAKACFEQGIVLNNNNSKVAYNYTGLGRVMLDEKNTAEAKKNFDKAFSLTSSKDPKVYMFAGEAYAFTTGSKDLPQAINLLSTAISIDKKNPNLYMSLGDIYTGQYDGGGKAMSNYEMASEINSANPKAFCRIGQLYIKAKNPSEALDALRKSLALDSTWIPAYREMGEAYFQMHRYEEAKEAYKKYISKAELKISALSRYASFQFLSKDYKGTIATVSQVTKMDSSNAVMNRLIGYSYYEQGKFQEGLAEMKRFFSKADTSKILSGDYEYYGKLLLKTNNDSMGIFFLRKAIDMDSSKAELHSDIAQSYYQKKRYREAASEYEARNERITPKAQDYFLLGKAWYYAQEYLKADTAFSKVIELQPAAAIGYLWRGRSSSLLDPEMKSGQAKPYYEKFAEIASADSASVLKYRKDLVEAYSYLGNYYLQKDDKQNTLLYYRKVVEMDPENKDARKVIEGMK